MKNPEFILAKHVEAAIEAELLLQPNNLMEYIRNAPKDRGDQRVIIQYEIQEEARAHIKATLYKVGIKRHAKEKGAPQTAVRLRDIEDDLPRLQDNDELRNRHILLGDAEWNQLVSLIKDNLITTATMSVINKEKLMRTIKHLSQIAEVRTALWKRIGNAEEIALAEKYLEEMRNDED